MNNKVAILGLISDLGNAAPFHDKKIDIWTMNAGFRVYAGKRIDVLFDMHDWYKADYMPKYYQELREMKRRKFRIIQPDCDPSLKNTQQYPIFDAVGRFGQFLKSSHSYMLAYASLRGYKEAYIYGFNMTEFMRHPQMFASFYHVEGIARAFGLKTYFIGNQLFNDDSLYGYHNLTWENADLNDDNVDNYVRKEKDTWEI